MNSSGSCSSEHSTTSPVAVTSVRPTTWDERLRSAIPLPWVAVLMAPASAWTSVSPRFSMAKPCSQSGSPSDRNRVPAHTVASDRSACSDRIPRMCSSESSVPFVLTSSV